MRALTFLTLFLLISSSATAARPDKIRILMEVQGILDRFSKAQDRYIAKSKQEALQVIEKMGEDLNPNSEVMKTSFEEAYGIFLEKYLTPMTSDEMVKVYSRYYGEKFTEEELDGLINFYTSDLGKKEVIISYKASSEFWDHFRRIREPVVRDALDEFTARIKAIQSGNSR